MSLGNNFATQMEVSIIIPVYNASKFLGECLESILSQSFRDFEVICINDGSTDNSLEILQQFQKRDARIKIINQKNQGVSVARNSGLAIAVGKYIAFVDGDDTIEPQYLHFLFTEAEKNYSDVVYSDVANRCELKNLGKILNKQEIQNFLLPLFFREDTYNAVWNKLYLNKIIQEFNLTFPVGITQGEDAQFNIEFLMRAQKISFTDYSGYRYREVPGSATRNIDKHDYIKRALEVYHYDWRPIIGDTIPSKELIKLKKIRFIYSILSLVYIYGNRGNNFTDAKRFSKLKEIVQDLTVKKVFSDLDIMKELHLNRFSTALYKNVLNQNVFLLYLLTQYSYYRSR